MLTIISDNVRRNLEMKNLSGLSFYGCHEDVVTTYKGVKNLGFKECGITWLRYLGCLSAGVGVGTIHCFFSKAKSKQV